MIQLGCFDNGVSDAACQGYLKTVAELTRVAVSEVQKGLDRIALAPYTPEPETMTVAQVQQGLKDAGFFTAGKVDGICGYRTQSAIRLFQEYVRTYEKVADMTPDGRFGPMSQKHLKRWLDGKLVSEWVPVMAQWQAGTLPEGDYTRWLGLLERAKQRYLADPSPEVRKVNEFKDKSSTYKVADWNFDPKIPVHLIGIRREEATGLSDDVFILLTKGLVFMFQGSTEPGEPADPKVGFPFLMTGQHDYHFGWHHKIYLALRPLTGVLVARWPERQYDARAVDKGLTPNGTINIHWGGRGVRGNIGKWSEGCQVISGSVYINPHQDFIDCRGFMAIGSDEPSTNPAKTRGAYNVVLDAVTALSSDQQPIVKYTLLAEADLDLDPLLKQKVAAARALVLAVQ